MIKETFPSPHTVSVIKKGVFCCWNVGFVKKKRGGVGLNRPPTTPDYLFVSKKGSLARNKTRLGAQTNTLIIPQCTSQSLMTMITTMIRTLLFDNTARKISAAAIAGQSSTSHQDWAGGRAARGRARGNGWTENRVLTQGSVLVKRLS